jgi:hypothetical protein
MIGLRCFNLIAVVVAWALAGFAPTRAADAATRRNVVVFVADDLGWRDLGYSGSTFY